MFRFRFQRALVQKEKEEKDKQNELYLSQSALDEEIKKEQKIDEEIKEFVREYEFKKLGKLNIKILKESEIYLTSLKLKKNRQHMSVIAAEEKVKKVQEEFYELRKERKMFEKLKEKQHEKYLAEENEKENKLIDELSNGMFNRRK